MSRRGIRPSIRHWQLIAILGLLPCACSPAGTGPGTQARQSEAAIAPAASLGARQVRNIGAICPLDAINGQSSRQAANLFAGSNASFAGWATVADGQQPVPPSVHLVLRPKNAPDAGKDVYLELGHMPRPDLSGGDSKRLMSGYEGTVRMPAQGKYDLLIAQGDRDWQSICKTGIAVNIAAAQ